MLLPFVFARQDSGLICVVYLCSYGEDSQQAQCDPGRHSVHVDPEGHPTQHDNQHGGNIRLDQVKLKLPLKLNVSLDAREHT